MSFLNKPTLGLLAAIFAMIPLSAQAQNKAVDVEALEVLNRIGVIEFFDISWGATWFPPNDCYRIWDGKSPLNNFVSKDDVKVLMTRDICDSWTEDYSALFQAYGYNVPARIFKSKVLKKRMDRPMEIQNFKEDTHAVREYNNVTQFPPGKKYACRHYPRTKLQYEPEYEVVRELNEQFPGSMYSECVRLPDYLLIRRPTQKPIKKPRSKNPGAGLFGGPSD